MSVPTSEPSSDPDEGPRSRRTAKRTYKPAAERREQILDCALEAFGVAGYHDTSIADVCRRAGIGRATLYQYFADKRALMVALTDRIAERVLSVLERRKPVRIPEGFRPSAEQTVEFMRRQTVELLRVIFEDANTARVVIRAARGVDSVVDDALARVDDAAVFAIEESLREGKRAGVVRDLDERFAARFILGGCEKVVLEYLDDDRPIDIEAIARETALFQAFGMLAR